LAKWEQNTLEPMWTDTSPRQELTGASSGYGGQLNHPKKLTAVAGQKKSVLEGGGERRGELPKGVE